MKNVFITLLATLGMATAGEAVRNQVEFTVEQLVGDRITDPDPDAVEGIAVLDATPGWEYSLNDRATWAPVANYSLLLNTSAWLRNPMDSQARLTYRAWDQTQGMLDEAYTITETGGATAFSVNSLQVVFTVGTPVDEDMRLPVTYKGLSINRNPATLFDVSVTIDPPEMGTFVLRTAADDPQIAGYFVPEGTLGTCTLTVSANNKNGSPVTPGTLTIDVVPGAAQIIDVGSLPQVAR